MQSGIDISNWQEAAPDWHAVARTRSFVYVLVTDGTHFTNPHADEQVSGACAAGLAVGGYHFARPTAGGAAEQAARFRANCPVGLTLPGMLDSERDWLADRNANTGWILDWFGAAGQAVNLWYSNGDGVAHHVDSAALQRAGVRLWLAAPGQAGMEGAGGWGSADVVQYGVEPVDGFGAAVDVDRMTDETLQWLRDAVGGAHPGPLPTMEDDEMLVVHGAGQGGPHLLIGGRLLPLLADADVGALCARTGQPGPLELSAETFAAWTA